MEIPGYFPGGGTGSLMTPHTLGVVDLGSNSFHLMIARIEKGHYTVLDTLKEPVRLRQGLDPKGEIDPASQARAMACLERFAQRLRGTDYIRVVGTNTMRRAKNTRAFLKKIEEILGEQVDVIGGIEEARLIYLGVASNLPLSEKRNLVIDIGGGSTEIIVGKNMEPLNRETRPIGCVGFSMEFFPDGIITKKRFNRALLKVAQEMENLSRNYSPDHWDRAIGASGTVKAIAHAIQAIDNDQTLITKAGLDALRLRIPWGKPFEDNPLPGLRDDRIPVFPGGLAILYGIFEAFGIESMTVSPYSMREGLLVDYLGRTGDKDVREETVDRLMSFYSVDLAQAERVRKTARALFQHLIGNLFDRRHQARKLLDWAARLHEMGLVIAHSGYHKHGAYIIMNGDLDGFSRVELCQLAFLVLNHRKRLKTDPLPYETDQEWPLVLILRLAFILNRERVDIELPDIAITWRKKTISLNIDEEWLATRPMTEFDLQAERAYWKREGYTFQIKS